MDDICKNMTLEEINQMANELKASRGSDVRIVIGQRGWVWVGYYSQDGDEVTIRNAKTIRVWGTTEGLGELINGPTRKTRLDHAGTVHLHVLAIIASKECDASKWDGVLC